MQKLLAVLLVAGAAVTSAAAAEEASDAPLYAEGRMLVLVSPAYPKEELAKAQAVEVNVAGRIRTDGGLENVRIEASPRVAAFELAVMNVLPLWRLQPRITSPGCGAVEAEGRVTIWFEVADGKPKVSYAARPATGAPAPEIRTDRKAVHMVAPLYPKKLAEDPKTPRAILQVAYVGVAEDGAVTGVTVAPMLYYREFEPLLWAALRQWKYAPQDSPWCAEVRFHMALD
jgi:hypothetical protein